jgi:PAS domain S-box-containing protein
MTMDKLKKELEETKKELERTKNAIWDMMNYSTMYVLILDSNMHIKFINWSLAIALGFQNEEEPIGRCWLDFIPEDHRKSIAEIHNSIKTNLDEKYREVVNDIQCTNGDIMTVKWFNTKINRDHEWTFSFGLLMEATTQVTEESIRSYYHDILKKDRTAILSLRDKILGDSNIDVCEPKV